MQDTDNRRTRIVEAPRDGAMRSGDMLALDLAPDEDVEWIRSHEPNGGSRVTGYRICKRAGGE